jgi:hypothetical protein
MTGAAHGEDVVEEQIGAEELSVASNVGPVHVDQRDIEVEGRHRDELFAVFVGRCHQLERRVHRHHVAAQPRASGVERHAVSRSDEPEEEGTLVEFGELDRARLLGFAEMGLERNRVERHESVRHLAHLARGAQQADLGPAVRDEGQIFQIRTENRPHERHRFAARAPSSDADGHTIT